MRKGKEKGKEKVIKIVKRPGRESGYTLVEVIASLLIITVLIVPLYFQLWQGLAAQQQQDEIFRLSLMAKQHLELLWGEYITNNRLITRETIFGSNEGQIGGVFWQVDWKLLASGIDRGIYEVGVTYFLINNETVTSEVVFTTRLMGELP